MINNVNTTNSSSNQSQVVNQNAQPTLEKRIASLKASVRWVDKIQKKGTLIRLARNLNGIAQEVQAELDRCAQLKPNGDPILQLEQAEGQEKWQDHLSDLEKYRGEVTNRASALLKSDAKGTK